MRAIPGTITEHPTESSSPAPYVPWVKSDELAVFFVVTDEGEVVKNTELLLTDILKPKAGLIGSSMTGDGIGVISLTVGYTTKAADVDAALARLVEFYGLEGVEWTHGPSRVVKP